MVLASSTQALSDTNYGKSKFAAEEVVKQLNIRNGNPVAIYRFPGIFGNGAGLIITLLLLLFVIMWLMVYYQSMMSARF